MSDTKICDVVRVGIDLAKTVFQVHGVNSHGIVRFNRAISREKLLAFTAQLPPCIIGMEACSGSHYWAKQFKQQQHEPRLMAAQHVKPYRRSSNKNDPVDAEAICEAAGRPAMRFVPIKPFSQLEIQAVHRHRQQLSKLVNALSSQMRGFLAEYGIVLNKGIHHIPQKIPAILEDAELRISTTMRDLIYAIYQQFKAAQVRLAEVDKMIVQLCKSNELCNMASKVHGIGAVTATAIYAAIGNGRQFKNGRAAAAWLGIVPRNHGSGGKTRNGRLSKNGSRYLKTLAIQGGRSVVISSQRRTDAYAEYVRALEKRKGNNIAAVACAHRNIRIVWAILARAEPYRETC